MYEETKGAGHMPLVVNDCGMDSSCTERCIARLSRVTLEPGFVDRHCFLSASEPVNLTPPSTMMGRRRCCVGQWCQDRLKSEGPGWDGSPRQPIASVLRVASGEEVS